MIMMANEEQKNKKYHTRNGKCSVILKIEWRNLSCKKGSTQLWKLKERQKEKQRDTGTNDGCVCMMYV